MSVLTLTFLGVGAAFAKRNFQSNALIEAWSTNPDEQDALLLPIIIEVGRDPTEATVICRGQVEEKVTSTILNMPVTSERGRIRIYKPQLALLRKTLKTTTQYVFLHESLH